MGSTYTCAICNHDKRHQIEDALMGRSWGSEQRGIEVLAKEFNVTARQLQVHAVLHMPAIKLECAEDQLEDKLRDKECDFLRNVMVDNYLLMKALKLRIEKMIQDPSADAMRPLSRNMTDLYIGCSVEVRNAVKALAEIRDISDNDTDTALNGMVQLVKTINEANVVRREADVG